MVLIGFNLLTTPNISITDVAFVVKVQIIKILLFGTDSMKVNGMYLLDYLKKALGICLKWQVLLGCECFNQCLEPIVTCYCSRTTNKSVTSLRFSMTSFFSFSLFIFINKHYYVTDGPHTFLCFTFLYTPNIFIIFSIPKF